MVLRRYENVAAMMLLTTANSLQIFVSKDESYAQRKEL